MQFGVHLNVNSKCYKKTNWTDDEVWSAQHDWIGNLFVAIIVGTIYGRNWIQVALLCFVALIYFSHFSLPPYVSSTSMRFWCFFAILLFVYNFYQFGNRSKWQHFQMEKTSILVYWHRNRIYIFPLPFISNISKRLPSSCLFSTVRFDFTASLLNSLFSSCKYFGWHSFSGLRYMSSCFISNNNGNDDKQTKKKENLPRLHLYLSIVCRQHVHKNMHSIRISTYVQHFLDQYISRKSHNHLNSKHRKCIQKSKIPKCYTESNIRSDSVWSFHCTKTYMIHLEFQMFDSTHAKERDPKI